MKMTFFGVVLCVSLSYGQDSGTYPMPIVGDGVTEYVFPASPDTFWILKHNQYLTAIKKADSLQITVAELSLLRRKTEIGERIFKLKDSIIDSVKFGYEHYKDLWLSTDQKLEQARIKANQRWTFLNIGFFAGVIASAVVINNL